MSIKRLEPGFTLVEMLLYSVTAAFVIASLSMFLMVVFENRVKNTTITEVEQQGQFLMNLIAQTARNAEAISVPVSGAVGTSLTLDVFDVADDPTVFSLSGAQLQVTEAGGAAINLTSDRLEVSNLSFEHLSNGIDHSSVRITFTLTHINLVGRQEWDYAQTFTTTAALRQ